MLIECLREFVCASAMCVRSPAPQKSNRHTFRGPFSRLHRKLLIKCENLHDVAQR